VRFNLRFNLDRRMLICALAMTAIVVLFHLGATAEQIGNLLNAAGMLAAGVLAGRSLQGPRPGGLA
jgi:hypothetical protein